MFIAQILGNIGRDAEIKNINGKDYISFSVASTEKESGEDVTRWISVLGSINNRNIVEYLKKGQQVFVSGRYSDKMYTHQNGVGIDRQIFAGTVQLCGGKRDEQATTPAGSPAGQPPVQPVAEPQQPESPFPQTTVDGTDGLPF